MNYTWMAPGMAEYFYSMATPNDYFIGCLSGPGYLYPKAVPPSTAPSPDRDGARADEGAGPAACSRPWTGPAARNSRGIRICRRRLSSSISGGCRKRSGLSTATVRGTRLRQRRGGRSCHTTTTFPPSVRKRTPSPTCRNLHAINAKRPYFSLSTCGNGATSGGSRGYSTGSGRSLKWSPSTCFSRWRGEAHVRETNSTALTRQWMTQTLSWSGYTRGSGPSRGLRPQARYPRRGVRGSR